MALNVAGDFDRRGDQRAMDLVEILRFIIIPLEIPVFQRPFRGVAVFVAEAFKIPLPQAKQSGTVTLVLPPT